VELFAVENRKAPSVVVSKPSQKMVEKVVVPSSSSTNNTSVALSGGSFMLYRQSCFESRRRRNRV